MSEKVKSRKLNMPMLEIILTLGILIVVGVFLMRLFLGANSLETKAKDISKATILVQSAAETIKAADSLETAITELSLAAEDKNTSYSYKKYFDSHWKDSKEPGTYTMTVSIEEPSKENLWNLTAHIKIVKNKPYPVIKDEKEPLAWVMCKSYRGSSASSTPGQ